MCCSNDFLNVFLIAALGEEIIEELGVGLEAREQVGEVVVCDNLRQALGGRRVELVVADEGGQRLVGSSDMALAGECYEGGSCVAALTLQCREHTIGDVTVEGREGSRGGSGVVAVEGNNQGTQGVDTANLAGSFDGSLGQLVVARTESTEYCFDVLCVVTVAQPADNVGLGVGLQLRERLDGEGSQGSATQFEGGVAQLAVVALLEGLQQERSHLLGGQRAHLVAELGDGARVGGDGAEVFDGVLHLHAAGGEFVQLVLQEDFVAFVGASGQSSLKTFLDGGALGLATFLGHVARQTVDGVLERGILALVRGTEHGSEALYTLGSRACDFAHHLLQGLQVLCRQLCQSVGNDGRGHTVAAVLSEGFADG